MYGRCRRVLLFVWEFRGITGKWDVQFVSVVARKWKTRTFHRITQCKLKLSGHATWLLIISCPSPVQQLSTLLDVTCCVRLHTLLFVACCCVLLGVVAKSLKPVKRLATTTPNTVGPTMLRLLRPFAHSLRVAVLETSKFQWSIKKKNDLNKQIFLA